MTFPSVKVLNAADTAVILRSKLGPLRSWPDFLSDNIRGRQNVDGYVLTPCARVRGQRGFQPHYAISDINAFVAAVRAVNPAACGGKPFQFIELKAHAHRPWRMNKFDQHGAPVARLHAFAIH